MTGRGRKALHGGGRGGALLVICRVCDKQWATLVFFLISEASFLLAFHMLIHSAFSMRDSEGLTIMSFLPTGWGWEWNKRGGEKKGGLHQPFVRI